jgi:acetyl-CoA acetyltransferase family protein
MNGYSFSREFLEGTDSLFERGAAMKDVVIVSACRTAIGTFGGTLRDSHAAKLAAVAMKGALDRAGIQPGMLDDIRFGCCLEPGDALNVARVGALLAGIPDSVTAVTINRVCTSGMECAISGMAAIQAGMDEIVLAGGTEHMSGIAYSVPSARWGCRLQDQVFVDTMMQALHVGSHLIPHPEDGPLKSGMPLELFKGKPYIMGVTAEFVAQLHNLSREELDEVALRSHNNAERATREGDFKEEIIPVELPQKKGPPVIFEKDEHFRPGLTMDQLAKLPPAFIPKIGKVTAGNSSGICDGAALAQLTDVNALQHSLGRVLLQQMGASLPDEKDNPTKFLGQFIIAGALATPLAHALTTPEGMAMLLDGQIAPRRDPAAGAASGDTAARTRIRFSDLSTARATVDTPGGNGALVLVLHREGLRWRWVGVELPPVDASSSR